MDLTNRQLVIFDIDGTLLATDRFWLDIGKRAVRTVLLRRSLQRELPDDRRFLDAIGLPMSEFWQYVLPPDLHPLAEEIESEAEELEEAAFADGLGAMYPGARSLLDELHAAGRQLALASNCGRRYLVGFIEAFALDPLLIAAYCADTPGIRSKADMVRQILADAGSPPALMVGDRESDRESATANGIPFVLFAGGFFATPTRDGDVVVRDYRELGRLLLPR